MRSNVPASPSQPPPPPGAMPADVDKKMDDLMKNYQEGCNAWLEDTLYTKLNEWSCMYTYQMEQDAQKTQESLAEVDKEKSSLVEQRSQLEKKLEDMNKSHEEMVKQINNLPKHISGAVSAAQPQLVKDVANNISGSQPAAASKDDVNMLKATIDRQNEMLRQQQEAMQKQAEMMARLESKFMSEVQSNKTEMQTLQNNLDQRFDRFETELQSQSRGMSEQRSRGGGIASAMKQFKGYSEERFGSRVVQKARTTDQRIALGAMQAVNQSLMMQNSPSRRSTASGAGPSGFRFGGQ